MVENVLPGPRVLVAGARVTGRAVIAALAPLGAQVTVCDDDPAALRGYPAALTPAEAVPRIADFDLVIASPGFSPTTALLAAAAAAGVPIWGDVELAWRLDASGRYGPPRRWLVVTGTNGKTTTTVDAARHAAGRRPPQRVVRQHRQPGARPARSARRAAGGRVVQLPAALGAVVAARGGRGAQRRRGPSGLARNVSALRRREGGGAARAGGRLRSRRPGRRAATGRRTGAASASASGSANLRRESWAFATGCCWTARSLPPETALSLASASSIPVPGPVGVLDALGAAALARAVDVPADAIAAALSSFRVAPHRAQLVAVVDGVAYVDDSKATNPHAAQASIAAYPRVIWVAGGLLKGASVDEMVQQVGESAGRRCTGGPGPGGGCQRVIATRPGCPRRRGDRGGRCCGARGP